MVSYALDEKRYSFKLTWIPLMHINSINHSLEVIGEPWTVTVRSLPDTIQEETFSSVAKTISGVFLK